jgi:hypothetical protein
MAANIDANLANWSTTDSSNQPDGTDPADIDADLRRLQATVRKYTRTIGANIASGATVDLATASGDYVTVTGTATITSLGTVSAGMRFWLTFNGAAVLTHNGTSLILPGAVNITCAAGDVACVESLGSGNWRVLSYLKASGLPIAGNFATAGANSNITSLTGLTTPLSIAQGGTGGNTQAASLTALGAALNAVDAKTAAYTVIAADRGKLIDATTGTWTLTLTAAATLGAGFVVGVRNSGTGTITIDPNASEQIDGATTIALAAGESCLCVCTGTAWKTVGRTSDEITATGSAPLYACRAWANFNGTLSGSIPPRASGNVSSVTDNGTGDYTVNFTTAMQDINYAAIGSCSSEGGQAYMVGTNSTNWSAVVPTTSACRIITSYAANVGDSTYVSFAVFR